MLVVLFRTLSVFPLPLLHALGAAMGWLVYGLSPSYRKRLRANLAQAGYDVTVLERLSHVGGRTSTLEAQASPMISTFTGTWRQP